MFAVVAAVAAAAFALFCCCTISNTAWTNCAMVAGPVGGPVGDAGGGGICGGAAGGGVCGTPGCGRGGMSKSESLPVAIAAVHR